ncbi:hypothetical protein [Micromonospora sp. NBC_01796]|uniref:hypothetical protein n=1 Tax=Micromonospora sp. NBC_01796 TaxID=2975987 RepID=UPI002DDC051C|nr:hypothetical protein [Micromonospora sp. NBC_01796]WSA83081.1 hypothetical protein OIE47_21980 [Micromonospora sp. NBC_01796]
MTDQYGQGSQAQPSAQPNPQPLPAQPTGPSPYAEASAPPPYPYGEPVVPPSYPGGAPFPYPDGGPYPYGDPGQPVAQRNRAKPFLVAAAGLLTLFVLTLGGLAIWDGVREDSGVAGCRSLADRTSGQNRELAEDEHRELREQFADSDIRAIREHGTEMMDVLWEVSKLPPGEEMGALRYLPQLSVHAEGLRRACAEQGVVISPNLPD